MLRVFPIIIRGLHPVTINRTRRPGKKSTNWFLLAGVATVFVVPSIATVFGSYFQGQEQDRYREEQLQGLYATRLQVDSRLLAHAPLQPVPERYQDPTAYPAQAQIIYRLKTIHVPDLFLEVGDVIAAPPLQRFDPTQVSVEPLGWLADSQLLAIRRECTPTTNSLSAEDTQTFLRSWLDRPKLSEHISTCIADLNPAL